MTVVTRILDFVTLVTKIFPPEEKVLFVGSSTNKISIRSCGTCWNMLSSTIDLRTLGITYAYGKQWRAVAGLTRQSRTEARRWVVYRRTES